MSRLLFADPGSRLVYRRVANDIRSAVGAIALVYTDDTGTVLADIREYDPNNPGTPGPALLSLVVDATSQIPMFWGPNDASDTLYVTVDGGPLTFINAYYDPRIDNAVTGAVPVTRVLTAGTGLTGGGDLSADRTFAVAYGTAAGTAAQGNTTVNLTGDQIIRGIKIFMNSVTVSGASSGSVAQITITPVASTDGTILLYFNTERQWFFKQTGAGSSAKLALQSVTNSKEFTINSSNGAECARFLVDDSSANAVLTFNGTVLIGSHGGNTNIRFNGQRNIPGPPLSGAWVLNDMVLDSLGTWWICITAGTPGTWISQLDNLRKASGFFDAGLEAGSRMGTGNYPGTVSGRVYLSYVTAYQAPLLGFLYTVCTGTVVSGLTSCRWGLYTVDASGNLTLVARTQSFTSGKFGSSFAEVGGALDTTGGFPATYQIIPGQTYVFGSIIVASSTMPSLRCAYTNLPTATANRPPRLGSQISGQTDLPTSIAVGSLGNEGNVVYQYGTVTV